MATNQDSSLPPTWFEEHDHFILYLAHSPTARPEDRTPEAIYENITGVFPYLGIGFYHAFLERLQYLSATTNNGKDMLPFIESRKYFWAYNPDYSPWTRRNPRREVRDQEWRGR